MNNRDDFKEKTKKILAQRVGYICSNPGCRKQTIGPHSDHNKSLSIGVAAHIKAASPGGPRYDKNMSSEERKSIYNGIWLCENCAKMIDKDIEYYTVELLGNWKQSTENYIKNNQRNNAMAYDSAKTDENSKKASEKIKDYTKEDEFNKTKTLNAMNEYFKWNLPAEDLEATKNDVIRFGDKLKNLPKESRKLLKIICERGEEEAQGFNMKYKVPIAEILQVCNIDYHYFKNIFSVLEKYNLCFIEKDWDNIEKIYLGTGAYDNWWQDIMTYCREKKINLSDLLVDLNFTVLD